MSKEKLLEQKNVIIEDFDFDSIHKVFKVLGIRVKTDASEKASIPSLKTLKTIAEKCMDVVINSKSKEYTCEMCGFEAEKKHGLLELRFVLFRVNLLGRKLGSKK
jgi:replication initiation and membrane attachment protein DnaB